MAQKFTLEAQIEEVELELGKRDTVYARLVATHKMKGGESDYRKARMNAVLNTLRWLQRNEARVRAAIGPDDQV
ncbi:MAG: hypothetical protein V4773_11935 [Verrucomicrobiota bacterium]